MVATASSVETVSLPWKGSLPVQAAWLLDRLLAEGHEVVGFDNFSTGQLEFLESASKSPRFRIVRGDLLDPDPLAAAMENVDFVFHLALRSGSPRAGQFL